MLILDENISREQWELLRTRRIRARHIGWDVGAKGLDDVEQIVPLLHRLKQPTLFTHDRGFYDPELCHSKYCIVVLDVHTRLCADWISRFLAHPEFRTRKQPMGAVVRAGEEVITVVRRKRAQLTLEW